MNQRLIPRLEMNWEFRKLTYRTTPKGALSPLAKVLKNLQVKLPTSETQQLIPNALHPQPSPGSKPQELYLKMKARRHDAFAALFIDLEGTLDHLNAKELLKRIQQAGRAANKISWLTLRTSNTQPQKLLTRYWMGKFSRPSPPHEVTVSKLNKSLSINCFRNRSRSFGLI